MLLPSVNKMRRVFEGIFTVNELHSVDEHGNPVVVSNNMEKAEVFGS